MNTITTKITYPEASEELKREIVEVRKLIRVFNKHEQAGENIRIALGRELLKLKDLYHKAMNNKRAGFTKWAAGQFKKAPKTIEHYMAFGRSGTTESEDRRPQNPVNRAKNAFMRLSPVQRNEFMIWIDSVLQQEEKATGTRTYRSSLLGDSTHPSV